MKHVYIVIQDGLVGEVLSDDQNIDVEVIDLDSDDPDVQEEADKAYEDICKQNLYTIL